MTTFTVSALAAPQPAPVNGLIFGYARSTAHGAGATARQRELLDEYSIEAFGRPLDDLYEDSRIPGAKTGRPGLDALKRAAQTDQVAVIVIMDVERISRRLRALDDFAAFCDRELIQLHTCLSGRYHRADDAHQPLATTSVS